MSPRKGKPPKRAANELIILLRAVFGDDRFPVDVEALAREVSHKNEDPIDTIQGVRVPGFDGMLRAKKRRPGWDILYSTRARHLGRQRFTLAHEFGHYVLHRRQLTANDYRNGELDENLDFQCLPLQADQWKLAEKQREHEADVFASYLLMPMDDYRKQVAGQDITLDLLDHVTDRYGVSLLAAVRKWIEFTTMRAAMVVARDGFALWGRASTAALKTGIFVRSGMAIPDGSVAAKPTAARNAVSDHPVVHPAGVWTFSRGSEITRELTIFSARFDISISILLFDDDPNDAVFEEETDWDSYDQLTSWEQR